MASSWICADASVVVRLLIDPDDHIVRDLWQSWQGQQAQIAAPTLIFYEITNALYRYQKAGWLSDEVVREALETALALPLRLFGEPSLHHQALLLADQLALKATYDAHYLALAHRLSADFWTCDRRLFNTAQERFPWVHLAAES